MNWFYFEWIIIQIISILQNEVSYIQEKTMSFDIQNCPVSVVSTEDFFNGLDPVKKKICEILRTFSDDAEAAYKAAVFILQIPDFPAKQSVVAHCMVNVIDAINVYSENILKCQLLNALKTVEFIKESKKSDSDIEKIITSSWNQGFKQLYDEQAKIRELFMDRNPAFERMIKDEAVPKEKKNQLQQELSHKIDKVNAAKRGKNSLHSCRHLNIKFHTISDSEFMGHIKNIENYILELDSPQYLEKKEVLDGILESANSKSD